VRNVKRNFFQELFHKKPALDTHDRRYSICPFGATGVLAPHFPAANRSVTARNL
jgi:hypothetical protein